MERNWANCCLYTPETYRKSVGKFMLDVDKDRTTYMSHKLKIIDEIGLFGRWVLLELSELFHENAKVDLELFFVVIRLPFDAILQLSESH